MLKDVNFLAVGCNNISSFSCNQESYCSKQANETRVKQFGPNPQY